MTTIPQIGIGTNLKKYRSETIEDLLKIIKSSIKLGYQFIDTGDVLNPDTHQIFNSLPKNHRKDLFISTRIYDYTTEVDFALNIQPLKYIDLLNFGNPPITTSGITFKSICLKIWSSMIILKNTGLAKHLGIINFHYNQAKKFLELCKSKDLELPEVAYIEVHPLNLQLDLVDLYNSYGIQVIAFSPLGSAGHHLYSEYNIIDIIREQIKAQNYVQTILATTISRGISVVVKTLDLQHLESNLQSLKYVKNVTEEHLNVLININMDTPFNNDSSNAIMASNQLA
jgi:diketogulonate reductase-like aldo/keto reductase